MAHTRLYRGDHLVDQDFPVEKISDHLEEGDCVVWLDLRQPSDADLEMIAEEFSLHRLAVEDATKQRQRSKLDRYETHLFLSVHATDLDRAAGRVGTHEVAVFVKDRALITVRQDRDFDVAEVTRRVDAAAAAGTPVSVGLLLHHVIDYAVDTQFATVEQLDEELERLEDLLFEDRPNQRDLQRKSFDLRKSLVELRRVALPMREVLNSLMRRDLDVVDADLQPYYQDVYDHVLRVSEWTDSLRDLISTVLETNLTMQGNRLNQIMKKLTGWAAVIAVPTAVTGFYGQNVPYPGYGHWSGFVVSSAIVVVFSGALIMLFRKQDWL